jgi:perosamine synthetase
MIPLFKVYMHPSAKDRVADVLDSGYIGQGSKVEEFEHALQQFLETDEAPLSVNSGTSALDLAYHLVGVTQGTEVISTAQTCTATNGALALRGADIVWADVDKYTGLIDPLDVGRKISRKTVAIVAVDWGGKPCDYDMLKSYGIPVIEDAAHAFGAQYHGRKALGGDYVMWSFQAIKHLTTGDGGALMTPLDQLERGRLLRWFGLDRRSSSDFRCAQTIQELGYKYQMNDIAAAIGLANIQDIQKVIDSHCVNAKYYSDHFTALQHIYAPLYDPDSAWWLYTLVLPTEHARDDFITYMNSKGISVSPVHARNDKHPPLQFPSGDLPGLDYFDSHQVSIPVGWWLGLGDVHTIIDAVITFDKTL